MRRGHRRRYLPLRGADGVSGNTPVGDSRFRKNDRVKFQTVTPAKETVIPAKAGFSHRGRSI